MDFRTDIFPFNGRVLRLLRLRRCSRYFCTLVSVKKCFGATKFNQESVDNYIFRIYGYSQQELNIKLNLHSIKAFGSLFLYLLYLILFISEINFLFTNTSQQEFGIKLVWHLLKI